MSDKLREALEEWVNILDGQTEPIHPVTWATAIIHAKDSLLTSHPPEAQAEGWQGLWKCNKCEQIFACKHAGYMHLNTKYSLSNECPGVLLPYDRRKSDEAGRLREAFDQALEMLNSMRLEKVPHLPSLPDPNCKCRICELFRLALNQSHDAAIKRYPQKE